MSHEENETELSRGEFVKGAVGVMAGAGALGLLGSRAASAAPLVRRAVAAPKKGGILQVAIGDANVKDTLDPGHAEETNTFVLAGNIYERLVKIDTNTWKWQPLLAESIRPNRQLNTWTIKLRNGIKFHDGRPLTAKDVAFTLRRILDKDYGNDVYAQLSSSLKPGGIKVVDQRTVVLHLTRPDAVLPITLGRRQSAIVPAGFTNDTTDTHKAIGTGPFRITSFKAGQGWQLERNPDYWLKSGTPLLDGVRAVIISEQATKLQSVVSGDSDLADGVDAPLAHTIDKSRAQLFTLENAVYLNIVLDQSVKPFTDPRISNALKHAVDRNKLLEVVQFGYGSVTADVPEPTSDFFYPARYQVTRDVELAKKLLADAGYPNGIDLELITSETFAGFVDLAVAFADQVKDAGFRIKVTKWPPQTYWDQVWLKKPMYLDFWSHIHPSQKLTVTYSAASHINENKYSDPKLEQLLALASRTADPKKQKVLYGQALQRAATNYGTVIPFFAHKLWPAKNSVHGVVLNVELGALFNKAWMD